MMKFLSQRDNAKPHVQMDTFKSEAPASILNPTGRKLDDCPAFLRLEASSDSEHKKKQVAESEKRPEPRFGKPSDCMEDECNVAKENIKHWTADPGEEACALIQSHSFDIFAMSGL
jgi:hypothetical protein